MIAPAAKLRIGEVHSLLREEFPTIELSKIRYYEEKGLVCPSRSRKGYRLYSPTDVACLREAFRMAQQEFVPLRVVRQRLIEQGLLIDTAPTPIGRRAAADTASNIVSLRVPVAESIDSSETAPPHLIERSYVEVDPTNVPVVESAVVQYFGATGARFNRADFLAATQLSDRLVRELEEFGFISPREVAGRVSYDECDLMVAKRFRVLAERGVETRHLQPIKRAVERQVDLLNDLTAPLRHASERSTSNAVSESRKVNDEIASLRVALMTKALQEYFGH